MSTKTEGSEQGNVSFGCPYEITRASDERSDSLERLLRKCVESTSQEPVEATQNHFWSAEYFGLDRSRLFVQLSPQQQDLILDRVGRGILEESQFIELAGMAYTAKMSLLSETAQQRQLYSFFAADEASHYRMISSIIGEPNHEKAEANSFLQYLARVVRTESRLPLMFLSQVILEGWGLTHYTQLGDGAQDARVASIFKSIVADEARHHGSGLLLFKESAMSTQELESVSNWLQQFLEMVRIGPFALLSALANENEGLSENQIHQFLVDVGFETKIQSDLRLMQALMQRAGAEKLSAICESKGLFSVPTAQETTLKMAASL